VNAELLIRLTCLGAVFSHWLEETGGRSWPRVYTEDDLCRMTGLSRTTLWRYRREGKLRPVRRRAGGKMLYSEEAVRSLLNADAPDLRNSARGRAG
jgi:hypothetical protein